MPFYEYRASQVDKACDHCKNVFEVMQPITADALTQCPQCGGPIDRLISLPLGFIDRNRQANQYNDIKAAKYWRDKNGNRHPVTPQDGSLSSPTVSRRVTASPQEVAAKKRRDAARDKKRRTAASYNRFVRRVAK